LFAILIDGLALSAFLLYNFSSGQSSTWVTTVMWLVWLFALVSLPKLFYAAGGILDLLTKLLIRRRVTIFRWFAAAVSSVLVVVMICGATIGRTKLKVNEVEICSDRVPEAFEGYRIVQISDIHTGTMAAPEKQISRLVEKIAELDPDMVVETGDLVNITNYELTPEIMNILSRITAADGVFSVWGNHDLGFYIKEGSDLSIKDNFKSLDGKVHDMGWRMLSNESVWIDRGGDSILLSGLNYPTGTRLNSHNNTLGGVDMDATFSGIEGEPFSVILAHTPQLWDEILATGFGDLTLSGHTHAMQLKLKLFGREWSPAEYLYREWSGKYLENGIKNRVIYINDGIGCVGYPMRIGARPEVTLFILKRCE
jgi:predicted MPP superfamily phosphohydrolase